MKRARWASVAAALAVAVLAATASLARVIPQDSACLGRSARLAARGIDVRWSAPNGDDVTACTDPGAGLALATLEAAASLLPADPTEPRIAVRFARTPGGRVREPRFDTLSGELRIDPASQALTDESIWLHELAHGLAYAKGDPRDNLVASRVRLALEEGVADYFAASLLHTTRVGAADGREPRDLAKAPAPMAVAWSTLPLARAPFAPHPLGSALAASLFARHGFDLPLARTLLAALRATRAVHTPSPRRFVDVLTAEAPARHDDVHAVLLSWLPPSLREESKAP